MAVNNDPNAQILLVSDFAVVADLFEFFPILIGINEVISPTFTMALFLGCRSLTLNKIYTKKM